MENNPYSLTPWRPVLIATVVVGFFWPLSVIIAPKLSAGYTALVAFAAGLFAATMLPSGELPPFRIYMAITIALGLIAQVVAWVTIPLFWCRLFSHNNFCTYPHHGGPISLFAIISFGLYLFLVVMIYLWHRS